MNDRHTFHWRERKWLYHQAETKANNMKPGNFAVLKLSSEDLTFTHRGTEACQHLDEASEWKPHSCCSSLCLSQETGSQIFHGNNVDTVCSNGKIVS